MLCPFCQRPVEQFLPPQEGGSGLRCPLCGEEGVPTLYPVEYDAHPAVPVSIFGPTGHGKTVFIEALVTHLERRVPWPGFSCQWMDQAGMRASRQRLQLLREHGQLPDATAAVFPRPQVVRLRSVPRVGGCQLLFYDTSGETFGDVELLRDRGRYVRNSPAVLWLVSLAELEYPEQLTDLMTVYAQAMAEMGGDPRSQTVVLALTKGDLLIDRPDLPREARDFLLDDNLDPAGDAWRRLETVSNVLTDWLLGTDHRQVVNLLNGMFKAVRVCILSAQGTAAKDQVLPVQLMPRGVLAPLFWLWRETMPVVWVESRTGREPHFNLPDAVAAAPSGSTVKLAARTYTVTQPLVIRRPITLAGEGPAVTVIRSEARDYGVGVAIRSESVTLAGLAVQHAGTEPADVLRVVQGSLVLRNCSVRGGVGSAGTTLGHGLRVMGESAATVLNSTVERNAASGVFSGGPGQLVLRDCQVRANGAAGVQATGASAEVTRCTVMENGQNGVHLSGQVRAVVQGCGCHKNKRSGIGAFLDSVAELRGNTCDENALDGVVLKDRAAVTADGNSCSRNSQAGISVHDAVTGTLSRNRCQENRLAGIEVEDEAAPTLEGNRCARNRGCGIVYSESAAGRCEGNTCERNKLDGVRVAGSAAPEIDGTTCTENGGAGFAVADEAAPTFGRTNTAQDNAKGEYVPAKWGRRSWFG